ncbi:MAG TPA: GNAT family N-acetyltransferase [Holophagaceae bacterium]|nr:GNAT family N-acetyltransferase [Holophagaceae bacterium]
METQRLRIRLAGGALDLRVGHRLILENQLAVPMGFSPEVSWQIFERPFRGQQPPHLYLIENRADSSLIGVVLLWQPAPREWPLMHYGLTPAYRGQGFATEAVREIVFAILNQGQVPGIAAIVADANVKSARVARSIGMSPLMDSGESKIYGIGREDAMLAAIIAARAAGLRGKYRLPFIKLMSYAWAVPYLRRTVLWLVHLLPSA